MLNKNEKKFVKCFKADGDDGASCRGNHFPSTFCFIKLSGDSEPVTRLEKEHPSEQCSWRRNKNIHLRLNTSVNKVETRQYIRFTEPQAGGCH